MENKKLINLGHQNIVFAYFILNDKEYPKDFKFNLYPPNYPNVFFL